MWKRGSHCHHYGSAISAMRLSAARNLDIRPAQALLNSAGSSP
jgi:hypothetical protein